MPELLNKKEAYTAQPSFPEPLRVQYSTAYISGSPPKQRARERRTRRKHADTNVHEPSLVRQRPLRHGSENEIIHALNGMQRERPRHYSLHRRCHSPRQALYGSDDARGCRARERNADEWQVRECVGDQKQIQGSGEEEASVTLEGREDHVRLPAPDGDVRGDGPLEALGGEWLFGGLGGRGVDGDALTGGGGSVRERVDVSWVSPPTGYSWRRGTQSQRSLEHSRNRTCSV